jgi:hypothetical protein
VFEFQLNVTGVDYLGAGCSGPALRIQTKSSSGHTPHVELVLDANALAQLHTALGQYAADARQDEQATRQ